MNFEKGKDYGGFSSFQGRICAGLEGQVMFFLETAVEGKMPCALREYLVPPGAKESCRGLAVVFSLPPGMMM